MRLSFDYLFLFLSLIISLKYLLHFFQILKWKSLLKVRRVLRRHQIAKTQVWDTVVAPVRMAYHHYR